MPNHGPASLMCPRATFRPCPVPGLDPKQGGALLLWEGSKVAWDPQKAERFGQEEDRSFKQKIQDSSKLQCSSEARPRACKNSSGIAHLVGYAQEQKQEAAPQPGGDGFTPKGCPGAGVRQDGAMQQPPSPRYPPFHWPYSHGKEQPQLQQITMKTL